MTPDPQTPGVQWTGERRVQQYGEGRPSEVEAAAAVAKDIETLNRMQERLTATGFLSDPMEASLPALMAQYEVPQGETVDGEWVTASTAVCIGRTRRAAVLFLLTLNERMGRRKVSL